LGCLQCAFMSDADIEFMRIALIEAEKARELEEVPIGACIVSAEGELLAAASNRTITNGDPTAHAEILALRNAAEKLGNYRLPGTTEHDDRTLCHVCRGVGQRSCLAAGVWGP